MLTKIALTVVFSMSSICWAIEAPTALIVRDNAELSAESDAASNLATHLTNAGYAVTTNVGVPGGSLSGYKQVWDIRFDQALTAGDAAAYLTYVQGGGSLVLVGETIFMAR